MKDFSLGLYESMLLTLQNKFSNIITFKEYFTNYPDVTDFLILRHDVDRKPDNALVMAELEAKLGVSSVYYFRTKKHTYKPEIIKRIAELGHEVGYHYESLTDCKGDFSEALNDFELNLAKLRKLCQIETIAMHGAPFSPFDNRELWKSKGNKKLLLENLEILGEVYLDIEYQDILYITDTGRNWQQSSSNRRDKVESKINLSFDSSDQLFSYFDHKPHNRFIFQTHPERWTDHWLQWHIQYFKDQLINQVKSIIR